MKVEASAFNPSAKGFTPGAAAGGVPGQLDLNTKSFNPSAFSKPFVPNQPPLSSGYNAQPFMPKPAGTQSSHPTQQPQPAQSAMNTSAPSAFNAQSNNFNPSSQGFQPNNMGGGMPQP